ncbi:diguanylate cyclase domain-containing protein [Exiguobacterium sp. SH5S13]|uniref:diguanylate cyclase domain-containing protein n=1 Tax=Exiguobacterium sp. SH5S13 TaxID=2510959 RepID=UPI001375FBF8|nr:diguanylate cyclase [Exiguobacterium sp. SH5S13]
MDALFRKTSIISLQLTVFTLAAIAFILYMPEMGRVHTESMLFVAFATVLTLFAGLRAGLFTSLAILFCFGSLYFWNLFFRPQDDTLLFDEATLFYYGISLIGLVILSGLLHERIKALHTLNRDLQEQVKQLVAIDTETGFDNRGRFNLELQLELDRTKRHSEAFTVFLYKIDYLKEFKKLYGQREYERFLLYFSERLYQSTRTTDKKFRLDTEEFALILPDASDEHMMILTDRFRRMLGDYETESGKLVTFTHHIAHYTVTEDIAVDTPDEILTLIGNELKSYAL